MPEPRFTVGIEEEYLLVDRDTRDLIHEAPPTMLPACEEALEGQVTPEFLQCQIEVGTRVCQSISEARNDLTHLRRTVASVARDHGYGEYGGHINLVVNGECAWAQNFADLPGTMGSP